jgi:Mrp family chromosome partitioning ATPase
MRAVSERRGRRRAPADASMARTQEFVAPAVGSELRYMLERIQLNRAAGLPRRVALTSALNGEGVSFIARSLGAIIARDLDRTVCLLDLNWWSQRRNQESPRPGLADVVSGDVDLDTVIVETNIPNLSFVEAGPVARERRSVLANSPQLATAIATISDRFDHVIFDLPAVLLTSDALTLARNSDAVAIVVREGVTSSAQVKAALDELRGIVSLGVILNRCNSHIPARIRRLIAD